MAHARRTGRRIWVATAVALSLATIPAVPSSAAPIVADGFETGNLSAWSGSAGFTVQQATVHGGSFAGRASSTGSPSHAWRAFAGQNELTADLWFNVTSRSAAVYLTSFRPASGGATVLVGINGKGRLIVRNNVTKVNYVSTNVVTSGVWHRLGLHAITGSGSRFDVMYDGASVATLSRTNNLGSATMARFHVGDSTAGRTFNVQFDDVSLVSGGGGPSDTTDPSQPQGVTATIVDPSTVDLDWQASSDDTGVTGYGVYRSLDGTSLVCASHTN